MEEEGGGYKAGSHQSGRSTFFYFFSVLGWCKYISQLFHLLQGEVKLFTVDTKNSQADCLGEWLGNSKQLTNNQGRVVQSAIKLTQD